jgi:archaellum component FlaF (FlaF/FlaG flagellin family)
MKKTFFLFAMLASIAASAQRTTKVTIANTKVDYSQKTVTFDLSWKGSDANHRDEVWVFVDIQPIIGVTKGNWSPATLVPNATTVTSVSGNQYSSLTYTAVSGNTRGVWIQGSSSITTNTFKATVKVTLLANVTPAKFNACAYASDYPPNAASYNAGTYTLKGTQPFIITGNGTIQDGNKYVGTVISSMTDATGCPGGVGRDVVHNGGVCAPGLTAVGASCRDLVADNALAIPCAASTGGSFELAKASAGTTKWAGRHICPTGWRVVNAQEAICACKIGELKVNTWMYDDTTPSGTCSTGGGHAYYVWFLNNPGDPTCSFPACSVFTDCGPNCNTATQSWKVYCVRL